MSAEEPDYSCCCWWSCDFVVMHAASAFGLIPAAVAVLLLVKRPLEVRSIFFAAFAALCTTATLNYCFRYYAVLWGLLWRRRRSASAVASGGGAAGHETTAARETSHQLRHPEQPVMRRAEEVQAALASGRILSYEHLGGGNDGGGGAADDCAVCLGEVEKGMTVRRLPACQHVFHRECIDLWLSAHPTCPVCRSGVLPAAPERALEEVVVNIGAVHGRPTI